uniref:Multi antimicrobial extrusion protein n=1 Tax=Echinostoma caproni TaxID=27848 RepID=A0A183AD45_9TREM
LAAQAIIYNLESLCYTLLPLGIGSAASIRVGHFLGARSSIGPKSVTSVSLIVMTTTAGQLLPILSVFQLLDGLGGVCSGIIRGAGLQHFGAIVCFISLYIFGGPLGMGLIFGAHYGIEGLWYGLCTGVILSSTTYLIVLTRLNWEKQVTLAMKRVNPGKFKLQPAPASHMNDECKLQNSSYLNYNLLQ